MKKGLLLCAVMCLVILLSQQFALADMYLKQKQKTDAFSMMGQKQPAQEFETESWISDSAMVTQMGDKGILIKEDGSMIMLDHVDKTYTEMNMDHEIMAEAAGEKMDAEEMAGLQQFMGKMMDIKISVEPTGEKKQINGYHCQKYIQTMEMGMGTNKSVIWATTDINVDADVYAKFTASMLANQPGIKQSINKLVHEMKKIKGVQVLNESTMNMMGQEMKSSVALLEIKEGKAPSNVFAIPKGYTKKAFGD